MKTNKISILLAAAALAAQTTFAVSSATSDTNKPAAKADTLFTDDVIAKGAGIEIKRSQLDDAFIAAKSTAAARGVTISDTEREILQAKLLDELIVSKILTARATDADHDKAKESAEKFIAETRKSFADESKFLDRLKLNKLNSVDELEKKLITEALPNLVLDREMKAQISVSDADIKKFYADNPAKFEQPEMVRASHILIGTKDETGKDLNDAQKAEKRKKVEALLKRAKDGEDFARLAKDNSDDPGSKDNGGEYTFPRGQMMPEFEAAAFALKKAGDISDVITTPYGYHIIKLSEKMPAKTLKLADAPDKNMPNLTISERIKDALFHQKAGKLIPGFIEKAEKDASVEILDTGLKAAKKKAADMAAELEAAGMAAKP
jgi:peptidyl-prolyl cis-trans isomerase C